MVIAGMINRVAFYCRVNHRDRDYEKYLDDVMRRLEEEYGKQKWDLQIFFEEASGADPNRKEFNRLKAEIAAKKIDVVVTMRAATIARNWGQFMEFMLICSKRNVEVVCIDKVEDPCWSFLILHPCCSFLHPFSHSFFYLPIPSPVSAKQPLPECSLLSLQTRLPFLVIHCPSVNPPFLPTFQSALPCTSHTPTSVPRFPLHQNI